MDILTILILILILVVIVILLRQLSQNKKIKDELVGISSRITF